MSTITHWMNDPRKWAFMAFAMLLVTVQAGAQILPAEVDMNLGPSTTKDEPSNVVLDLSVEFPTVGAAYRNNYDPAVTYIGYWDSKACYRYKDTATGAPLSGNYFFRSNSVDKNGNCNNSTPKNEYSGNLLNFAASSAIDILRLALTGGNREIDTTDTTILARAYLRQGWNVTGNSYFPVRTINSNLVGKQLPSAPSGTTVGASIYAGSCQNFVWLSTSSSASGCAGSQAAYTIKFGGYYNTNTSSNRNAYNAGSDSWAKWDWSAYNVMTDDPNWCQNPQNYYSGMPKPGDTRPDKDYFNSCTRVTNSNASVFLGYMHARVKVCEPSDAAARKSNGDELCTQYPSGHYKPVGQVQLKSDLAKFGVFAYTADGNFENNGAKRYGGVMRAPLASIGPTVNSSTGVTSTNPDAEWNNTTGVYITKPRTTSNGVASYTQAPKNGAINYLNGFGTLDPNNLGYYKEYDSFGGMYLESLRYFAGETAPDSNAISGADSYADNFPYYTTWKDPISNACQRNNYILAIGDVNTWDQASIKGKTIAGSDLETWLTRVKNFEQGTTASFTGADGVPVNTRGNPDPRTIGGSGQTLTRQMMAGAAYAAHTQPIRSDTKEGQSLASLRVNTFAIDVDEGGNGTLDSSSRGIQPRDSSLYLMGKYGWFDNSTKYENGTYAGKTDNHPFTSTAPNATPYDNNKWQDPAAPKTPDGYVIASQADRMLEGIKKFFNAIKPERATIYGSALSNSAFNSNATSAGLYIPTFSPLRWTGSLQRFGFHFSLTQDANGNVTGSSLQKGNLEWDAGKILTEASMLTAPVSPAQVIPSQRKIFTLNPGNQGGAGSGQAFSTANWSGLDIDFQNALKQDWSATTGTPPAVQPTTRDTAYALRVIDYIRGVRDSEQLEGSTDPNRTMRARTSIMGDVIHTGPVYKKSANPEYSGGNYGAFAATQKTRTAVVYIGANDGMLHAFKADAGSDGGKELFAYIPRAVAENLNRLPNPAYSHIPFVDGQLTVDEAQITDTSAGTAVQNWKTLLVGGMGGGAQGIYALDVTDPDNFSAGNVLFEFTDAHDPDIGNINTAPSLVKIRTVDSNGANPLFKWYVAVSSGFNNFAIDGAGKYSTTGDQALFLLSVDKKPNESWQQNTNWFKIKVSASSGLSNPGIGKGLYGDAQIFYAGDTSGALWKFDLQDGLQIGTAPTYKKNKNGQPVPLAIARANASAPAQPITTVPQIAPTPRGGNIVMFGTGKFMESTDTSDSSQQGIYGIWDDLTLNDSNYEIDQRKLYARTINQSTLIATGNANFTYGTGTGKYRGWYVQMVKSGERIITDGALGTGYIAFSSLLPDDGCGSTGAGRLYQLNTLYGSGITSTPTDSYLGRPIIAFTDESANENTYGERSITGRRKVSLNSTPIAVSSDGSLRTGANKTITLNATGRISWREIKNFK